MAQAGLKVVEVPSYERSREFGASNLHAPRDGLRVLRTILVEAGRARRLRRERTLAARAARELPVGRRQAADLDEAAVDLPLAASDAPPAMARAR
jgi:hypothetical protein